MLRQTLFRLSQEPHVREFATHNSVARGVAERFVAGDTLEQAMQVVRDINARGMTATLDHLGENVSSRDQALEETHACCALLRAVTDAGAACTISLKLTQLGLDLGDAIALENVRRVIEQAAQTNIFVRIDMEGSAYTDRTLQIFYSLFEHFRNVGTVIQANLHRSPADLEHLIKAGARVRLVKGAYLEPPSIAFGKKADVDSAYLRLTERLLLEGQYPAIATHDPRMIAAACAFATQRGIEPARYEFQMLYGIRRDLQSELTAQGYGMRVYIPYGTHWYPYLVRRMAERPANVVFVLNNLAREVRSSR